MARRPSIAIIVAGFAAIAIVGGLSARAADAAEIRWATEGTYPPWNETAANGRLSGFDVELVAAICAHLQAECPIAIAAFPAMMDAVAAGAYDAIISGIAITGEREQRIAFTRPYMALSVSFAIAAGSTLASAEPQTTGDAIAWLAASRIGVQRATVNAALISAELPDATLVGFDDQESLNQAVAEGRVDAGLAATPAWSDPQPMAPGTIVTFGPALASTRYPLLGQGLGIGLAKGNAALRTRLDAALCALATDGTITGLSTKWFGEDLAVHCAVGE